MSKPTRPSKTYLRIGEIAERSGVSAKALRLYEQRGLLKPCTHSEAGYRLYGPDALRRLMQIVVLKRGGFSLAEIAGLQSSETVVIAALLGERIEALQRDLADKTRALATLRTISQRMGSASTLDLDQLLESIHMGSTLKLDLSDAERDVVRQRAEQIGGDNMKALHNAYPELIAQMRAAMAAGRSATDPGVVEMARRYRALAPALPDIDPAVKAKLVGSLGARPDVMAEHGLDSALLRYLRDAIDAEKASRE
jgi:DNA-binding transcriptional MerR regulator